jgi:nucleoside-diphosphate-sugar epimerase
MILITGATGFVGRHLIRALKTHLPEKPIRILARTKTQQEVLREDFQVFLGDIQDAETIAAIVRDVELVIHLAAKIQPSPGDTETIRQVNVEGTRRLYSGAVAAGCKFFLHVSSAGVYGPARSGSPFREDDACNPVTPYQITKYQAERALGEIEPKHTTLNILRPTGIYGSGSLLELDAYKQVLVRRWSLETSGGVIVHPVHVHDVVGAILALVKQPAPAGTVVNLGGECPILVQDLFAVVAKTMGVDRRRIVLPPAIAGPLGSAAGRALSLIGRPKPMLAGMSRGHTFSVAVDDSRFRQRFPTASVTPLVDGIREHIDWARSLHLI